MNHAFQVSTNYARPRAAADDKKPDWVVEGEGGEGQGAEEAGAGTENPI